ncbi:MAG: hypothetical protein Fur0022_33540 [Anaerolineales bacterium]
MMPPDPKRSKEITTPRRNVGPLPPLEPVKNPDKKLEPTVVVAIISAVVTLITAVLSSPLLLALVNQDPDPTSAPSVGEMGMAGTLLPESAAGTPTEELTTLADPLQTTPPELIPSPTTQQPDPSDALPTNPPPAPENTTAPTQGAVSTQPTASSWLSCFTVDVWFPFPANLNPGVTDGCWNLADWGFSTEQGHLLLVHNPEVDQQRGVYLPISGDVKIQFSILMNEFRSRSNKGGFLHFGIVQDDPFSNYNGGYLSYQQPSPGAASPVRVLVGGTNQATKTLLILEKGFQQQILLSVQGDVLTVFLDGAPLGDPVNLPLTKRAFWIGYVLPANAELDVYLTNFTLEAQ